jgi:hypothetical protein
VALLRFPAFPPGWAADGPFCKNESAILRVVLPHLRAAYGAGPISLLGFAQGGAWRAPGGLLALLRRCGVACRALTRESGARLMIPSCQAGVR